MLSICPPGTLTRHQGRYTIRETTSDKSANTAGDLLNRSPVIAINIPLLYTSTPRPLFLPGISGSRPTTCKPRPDCDTPTNVGGHASTIRCAQSATRPSTSAPSRSMQPTPLPSANPTPLPVAESLADTKLVHVSEFVEDAGRPSTITGRFESLPFRSSSFQRIQRSESRMVDGIASRLFLRRR